MKPIDRCTHALEAQRTMRTIWPHATNDAERALIENVLVTLREYLRAHCQEHNIPLS